ncbi:YD repeat-containing protein [Chitinophaga polysaccharea]|uniref:YD repeat-containing protein n=1 Tax=Chitinophaga polysaccharea TaxID=1293035 RepID=A0A561Q506_9BACT|nr:RHS repeat domain-containing protein [Chitinophaga polysaccharea]TWF45416.1 YD repeat-containing protein [Chitinophaga polysaccharea]
MPDTSIPTYTRNILKMFVALLTFFSLLPASINAQSSPPQSIEKMIPVPPNAAALGKYGEVPVGLYTGIPQISVPIYEIQADGINLPISLSYHAGGVKVEEVASNVGLGWSLNAGGVITRTQRGKDDLSGGFPYYTNVQGFNTLPPGSNQYGTSLPQTIERRNYLSNLEGSASYDLEPDIFYFNFGNYSGKFVQYPDGNFYAIPQQNIKIKCEGSGRHRWILTTQDGAQYVFGLSKDNTIDAIEYSGPYASGDENESSWYLAEIITPNGRNIRFNYSNDHYSFKTVPIVTKYIGVYMSGYIGTTALDQEYYTYPINEVSGKRLKSIDFNYGLLTFDSGLVRRDLYGTRAITGIRIHSKLSSGIKEIKHVNLYYSYFSPQGTSDTSSVTSVSPYDMELNTRYRLKLDSVKEFSADEKDVRPPFSFIYNTSKILPPRLSTSVDHWGYFNNKINDNKLLPSNYYIQVGGTYAYNNLLANREPDEQSMKTGVLTQINYPTGGTTKFTYESNRANAKRYVPPFPTPDSVIIAPELKIASCSLNGYGDSSNSATIEIKNDSAIVKFYSQTLDPQKNCYCNCFNMDMVNTANNHHYTFNVQPSSSPTDYFVQYKFNKGTYKLFFYKKENEETTDNNGNIVSCNGILARLIVKAQWLEDVRITNPDTIGNVLVGGLRVTKTEDFDGIDTNKTVVKLYNYQLFDDTVSSGTFVYFPVYFFKLFANKYMQEQGQVTIFGYSVQAIYESTSSYPLQTTGGGYVGYSNVTVTNADRLLVTQSRSRYTYTSPADFPDERYDRYPTRLQVDYPTDIDIATFSRLLKSTYPPFGSMDWKRGQLIQKDDYLTKDTGFMLIKRSKNTYQQSNYTLGRKLDAVGLKYYKLSGAGLSVSLYLYNLYNTPTDFQYLSSSDEIIYGDNGQAVTQHSDYYYEYPDNLLLSRREDINSKGDTLKTYFYYPTNKSALTGFITPGTSGAAALDSMTKRNMIEPVILQRKYNNGKRTAVLLNSYKLWGANKSIAATDSIKQQIGDFAMENTDCFTNYDANGNIQEASKVGNTNYVFIWGYKGQYPVAKIIGSNYNSASPLVNQIMLDNATDYTDDQLRTELNKLRSGLPGALISTYTYTPLVGLTSETDPTGRTTYYQYDGLGRLKVIKDQDGKILKQFDYQYNKSVTQ